MAKIKGESIVWWQQDIAPNPQIVAVEISDFDARGLRSIYGRGDNFGGRKPELRMDLWRTSERFLLARFWSRGREVDWEAWQVNGSEQADYPLGDERWVACILQQHYKNWVLANL